MKSVFHDISRLFYPDVCAVCGCLLPEGGEFICTKCRWDIPLTRYWNREDNPVVRKFMPHFPIVRGCAFFYYVHHSGFRGLVHKFKFGGEWKTARNMGLWFGAEIAGSGMYGDVDVVVPVPVHIRRKLQRGYNQAEYIADGISRSLGVAVDSGALVRSRYGQSQTTRSKSERWDNVKESFTVRRPERLQGKHILLVDDVLTTGATIISCAEAILSAAPGARISVATLAVSKSEI